MKTEQQLMAYNNAEDFAREVNERLEAGWKVIPGTHVAMCV